MSALQPNAADMAKATAFVDGPYRIGRDPEHHAFHREANLRRIAMFEAAKRRETDWRLTIALRVIQAFAIGSMSSPLFEGGKIEERELVG